MCVLDSIYALYLVCMYVYIVCMILSIYALYLVCMYIYICSYLYHIPILTQRVKLIWDGAAGSGWRFLHDAC